MTDVASRILDRAAARMLKQIEKYQLKMVKTATAKRKARGLPLTKRQKQLAEYIALRGGNLEFSAACLLEWRSLGGLMTRGHVKWEETPSGRVLRAGNGKLRVVK